MRIPRLALHTLALLTCAALSTLAAAQDDVPGRVGRIALTQGAVGIGNDAGTGTAPAQVNWPVTSGTMITTARGARTELRIGSTSVRLDGDSALEVTQLDDANLSLRLHYGSASVRVLDPDTLAGFELATPQARVRLQQPGRVRVDAERVRDTSMVEVFEGVALVDGGGSELTLRAGKGAELGTDDVRTLLARQDAFDDWSLARDRAGDSAASARYVGTDMTGYEDLDRYGSWTVDSDYGPLWTPVVSTGWVPYSDGSWVWLDPWGWTWVDDAPWGYAPFHYGRWVFAHHRWSWAPGRHHEHPVWAPALVGWVGGGGWNITFRDRHTHPASGWYPLSPHDRFVPSYHASENHRRWVNNDVRPDPHRPRNFRPQGLTVVPEDRFAHPGRVDVAHAPRVTPPALPATGVTTGPAAAPPPPNRPQRGERFVRTPQHWPEHERGRESGIDTDRVRRDDVNRQGPTVLTAPSVGGQPTQGLVITSPPPQRPTQGLVITSPPPQRPTQGLVITSPTPHRMTQTPIMTDPPAQAPNGWQRHEHPMMQAPATVLQPARPMPQTVFEERERAHRGEWERPHAAPAPAPMPAPVAPAPVAPRPMPAPVMAAPPPAPAPVVAAPPPRPAAPAPQHGGEAHARVDQRGPHQQER